METLLPAVKFLIYAAAAYLLIPVLLFGVIVLGGVIYILLFK